MFSTSGDVQFNGKISIKSTPGWSDCVVKTLVDCVCCVVRFERNRNDDSRTVHVLNGCLHASITQYSSGELKFMFGTQTFVCLFNHFDSYVSNLQNWSLHDSNSTRTRGSITQNRKNWRDLKLNHKHRKSI